MSTTDLPLAVIAERLAAALLLGKVIGAERQWQQKMAGLKTNALVALGASGFVTLAVLIPSGDPGRIAAQIVTGIGFLGAGVIMRDGFTVHGLNTAATLWCSAMVGALAGVGLLPVSFLAAALVLLTNMVLRPVTSLIDRRPGAAANVETQFSVSLTCQTAQAARLRQSLRQSLHDAGIPVSKLRGEERPSTGTTQITAQGSALRGQAGALEKIVGPLGADPGVSTATWEIEQAIPEI